MIVFRIEPGAHKRQPEIVRDRPQQIDFNALAGGIALRHNLLDEDWIVRRRLQIVNRRME